MVEGSQRETILVVDDDSYVRSLVVKILAQRGYTALPAADAWQAMDILQEQPIDLIILDLRMPGPVDGEQLLHALHDHGYKVPIIILSGWVNDEMSLNPPAGVHTVMKKPIDIDTFAATVALVLGKSCARQD